MKLGISSSCFYPIKTELALKEIVGRNISCVEIFINTYSEMEFSYIEELKGILDGCEVLTIHPFTSEMETSLFFSNYQRRFDDGVELYKKFFTICNQLKAQFLIFHGVLKKGLISDEVSFERYAKLLKIAKAFDVTLLQENVARCKSGDIEYIEDMKKSLGDDVNFVLDIKQSIRSGVNPYDMAKAMGDRIKHIHISDSDEKNDCKLPLRGKFDFIEFKNTLEAVGFQGSAIIEVYRDNYKSISQLFDSYFSLKKLIN